MCVVRIAKNWTFPSFLRQSPAQDGVWEGIRFTEEPVRNCDYLVVSNLPAVDLTVRCPPEHVWAIMQEPPNEISGYLHNGQLAYQRIFTTDPTLIGPRYVQSQPALPWFVGKSYTELLNCGVPEKSRPLSWITSNRRNARGHIARLNFLAAIQGKVDFDLYGRGFRPLADKWDGLAPYRYALVVENFRGPLYWSEKLADAFLAWSMPIYCGCTNITDYFPAESMICIDIDDPDVAAQINAAVASRRWKQNLDAIAEARKRVLNRYQLLPLMADQIRRHRQATGGAVCHTPQTVAVKGRRPRLPLHLYRKVVRGLRACFGR